MISGDQFNKYDVCTYRTTRVQCSITRIWRACIYNYTHKTCTLCVITRNYASTTARMQFFYRMRLTTSTGHGSATNYTCLACVGLLQYTQAVLCLVGGGSMSISQNYDKIWETKHPSPLLIYKWKHRSWLHHEKMNQNVLSHKDYFLSNHAGMALKLYFVQLHELLSADYQSRSRILLYFLSSY